MEVPELTPLEDYDSSQAKVKASVCWLVAKANERQQGAPLYQNPVTTNAEEELVLDAGIIAGLTSGDLYCKACASIFRDSTMQWQGHWSVIQTLSRKGLYVMEENESAVTDSVLMQTQPFKLKAHLALMNALMVAYAGEVVTIERVVQAVRRFASFNASSELPYDVEDALMFWINKVCASVRHQLDKTHQTNQDTVHKGQLQERKPPEIPVLDDLLKDLNDGCCLATLVSFYCPGALKLEDICLSETAGIADSLYNLQLLRSFCDNHLPTACLHLSLDDLFYTHASLKENILAFTAELFYCFEVKKAECVRVVTRDQQYLSSTPNDNQAESDKLVKSGVGKPPVPISNVTKRSFMQSDSQTGSSPDLRQIPSSPTLPHRQPLLQKRLQQQSRGGECNEAEDEGSTVPLHSNIVLPFGNTYRTFRRSNSLTSADERETIKQSVIAWEDKQAGGHGDGQHVHIQGNLETKATSEQGAVISGNSPRFAPSQDRGQQQCVGGNSGESHGTSSLLANVSIDSEMMESFTDDNIGSSISVDVSDLEDTPRSGVSGPTLGPIRKSRTLVTGPIMPTTNRNNPLHPDYLELESISSRAVSQQSEQSVSRLSDRSLHMSPPSLRSSTKSNLANPTRSNPGNPHPRNNPVANPHSNPGSNPHQRMMDLSRSQNDQDVEPLMPAKLKPAKEKSANHNKEVESGEVMEKKSPSSPPKPKTLDIKQYDYRIVNNGNSSEDSSTPDEDYQTPSVEVMPDFPSFVPPVAAPKNEAPPKKEPIPVSMTHHTSPVHSRSSKPHTTQPKKFEAFFVDTHGPIMGPPLTNQHNGSDRGNTAQSFTLHDSIQTPEAAKAAGIPIVESEDTAGHHDDSRSSGRSSGEYSDQELRKIHHDHRHKEGRVDMNDGSDMHRPDSLPVPKPIKVQQATKPSKLESPKTSFAQIKKLRENGEVTDVYSQHQMENTSPEKRSSLKSEQPFTRHETFKIPKKTTFAALPNQTTWQESAQRTASYKDSNKENQKADTLRPLASELINVRLNLEEKRREIEMRKKKKVPTATLR